MKLSYLWHGLPGHPIHSPLTDVTVGAYTFATIAAFIRVVGITTHNEPAARAAPPIAYPEKEKAED
jgi:hypothetical protein